jgi:cell wall-associated NlpC family hydrolase
MASPTGREVGMYTLMLLKTGYQFGGKNPAAGLDCSGLVTHVYREAADMRLAGNAASLAREGREVPLGQIRTGDLVFFNTLGRPFSHVGIYLGSGEFIHAPNSRGQVRIEKLTTQYWAQRFEMARTLLN